MMERGYTDDYLPIDRRGLRHPRRRHKSADCGENLVGSFREFLEIQRLCGLQMAIAGGIDIDMLEQAKPILAPDMVIIGKAVVNAPDMEEKSRLLRQIADR